MAKWRKRVRLAWAALRGPLGTVTTTKYLADGRVREVEFAGVVVSDETRDWEPPPDEDVDG